MDVVTVSRNSFSFSARVLLTIFSLPARVLLLLIAYLNYAASSWKDSREDSKSRSPLRRPWYLKSAAQGNFLERRQPQRTSGFQVAGAPCGLAEYTKGDLPKYVCAAWNVECWLSELDALGWDPAFLSKLVHLNKLDPKLANYTVLSFFMRISDGFNSVASPADNTIALGC